MSNAAIVYRCVSTVTVVTARGDRRGVGCCDSKATINDNFGREAVSSQEIPSDAIRALG
jgi:hypothetical protein